MGIKRKNSVPDQELNLGLSLAERVLSTNSYISGAQLCTLTKATASSNDD